MIEVTITRDALALADLVVTSTPGGDFWIDEDGLVGPEFAYRYAYAAESRYIAGRQLLAAVLDADALSLPIYAKGASAASLETNKNVLIAAVGQFSYETTLLVDGQGGTYSCDPTRPRWGAIDSGMAAVHMARASVTIPVNPPGA